MRKLIRRVKNSYLKLHSPTARRHFPLRSLRVEFSGVIPGTSIGWGMTSSGHHRSPCVVRPNPELLRGLDGARYHLTHLGLAEQESTLNSLINEVQTMPETAMSREWRNGFSGKVSRFVTEVGKLAAKNQSDFEKDVT